MRDAWLAKWRECGLPPRSDRILHMGDRCKEEVTKTREMAEGEGIEQRLDDALDYLRTYSSGPETGWKTTLNLDLPHTPHNYIAVVYRRLESEVPEVAELLKHFMTIGMIWNPDTKDWSFHS